LKRSQVLDPVSLPPPPPPPPSPPRRVTRAASFGEKQKDRTRPYHGMDTPVGRWVAWAGNGNGYYRGTPPLVADLVI